MGVQWFQHPDVSCWEIWVEGIGVFPWCPVGWLFCLTIPPPPCGLEVLVCIIFYWPCFLTGKRPLWGETEEKRSRFNASSIQTSQICIRLWRSLLSLRPLHTIKCTCRQELLHCLLVLCVFKEMERKIPFQKYEPKSLDSKDSDHLHFCLKQWVQVEGLYSLKKAPHSRGLSSWQWSRKNVLN